MFLWELLPVFQRGERGCVWMFSPKLLAGMLGKIQNSQWRRDFKRQRAEPEPTLHCACPPYRPCPPTLLEEFGVSVLNLQQASESPPRACETTWPPRLSVSNSVGRVGAWEPAFLRSSPGDAQAAGAAHTWRTTEWEDRLPSLNTCLLQTIWNIIFKHRFKITCRQKNDPV